MKLFTVKARHIAVATFMLVLTVLMQQQVNAAPFGQGPFGAHIPFGSLTSLSISLGGNVSFGLTSAGGFYTGSGSHTITVTSTDPEGYQLYAHTLSTTTTNMTDATGTQTIPASSNSSSAPLATNTWGYNTDGSSNYLGMLTTPSLIKSATGPYESGDNTTVYYGLKTDLTTGAGIYTVGVVYTAVAINA